MYVDRFHCITVHLRPGSLGRVKHLLFGSVDLKLALQFSNLYNIRNQFLTHNKSRVASCPGPTQLSVAFNRFPYCQQQEAGRGLGRG